MAELPEPPVGSVVAAGGTVFLREEDDVYGAAWRKVGHLVTYGWADVLAAGDAQVIRSGFRDLPDDAIEALIAARVRAEAVAERAAIIEVLSEFAPLALPHNDLPTIVRGIALQRDAQHEFKDYLADVARRLTEERDAAAAERAGTLRRLLEQGCVSHLDQEGRTVSMELTVGALRSRDEAMRAQAVAADPLRALLADTQRATAFIDHAALTTMYDTHGWAGAVVTALREVAGSVPVATPTEPALAEDDFIDTARRVLAERGIEVARSDVGRVYDELRKRAASPVPARQPDGPAPGVLGVAMGCPGDD